MSLINQMLRDLEARRSDQPDFNGDALSGVVPTYDIDDSGMPWPVFIVLIVLAAIVAIAGLKYWHDRWLLKKHHTYMLSVHKLKNKHELTLAKLTSKKSKVAHKAYMVAQNHIAKANEQLHLMNSKTQKTLSSLAQEIKLLRRETHAKNEFTISQADASNIKKSYSRRVRDYKKRNAPPTVASESNASQTKTLHIKQRSRSQGKMSKVELPASPLELADKEYRAIIPYIDHKMYTASIKKLRGLLKKYPEYYPARMALAQLLQRQNRVSEAVKELKIGLKHSPDSVEYSELLATLLTKKGKLDDALMVLERTQPNIGDNPDYYALMAGLYEHLGKYSTATSLYKQLLHINPNNAVWWMGLGISSEGLGDMKEAMHAYNKARTNPQLQPDLRTYVESRINALEG